MAPPSDTAHPLSLRTLSGCLIWAHLLLIAGVAPRKGADELGVMLIQVSLVGFSWVALLLAHQRSEQQPFDGRILPALGAVLVCSGVLFTLFGSTGYGARRELLLPFRFLCLPVMFIYFLPNQPPARSALLGLYRSRRLAFWILCLAAPVLRVAALWVSRAPAIDVFWFTNEGALGLVEGINPYDRSYSVIDPRSEFLYAYLPAQFLLDVPSRLLLGDMRYGQILAEMITALLLYRLVAGRGQPCDVRRHSAEIVALLLLYFPQALRMQEQSWVEFKQVFAVAAFAYFLSRRPSSRVAWVILGLLLSLKQTAWALLVFVRRLPEITPSRVMIAVGVFSAVVVPFFLWNPEAFLDDVVVYHLNLPLPRSISVSRLLELVAGTAPGLPSVALGAIALLAFLSLKGQRTLLSFLIASAGLSMYPVVMRQAFLNYFYFVDGIVLVTLAALIGRQHDHAGAPSGGEGASGRKTMLGQHAV